MPHFSLTGDGKAFNRLLTMRSILFTLVSLSSYHKASYDSAFRTVDCFFPVGYENFPFVIYQLKKANI